MKIMKNFGNVSESLFETQTETRVRGKQQQESFRQRLEKRNTQWINNRTE
jgi:hypothetical protein